MRGSYSANEMPAQRPPSKVDCQVKTSLLLSTSVTPSSKPRESEIDWQRHGKNIRSKVENWFEVMDKQLFECGVLQEKVYNMDEPGALLSDLTTMKVLVSRSDVQSRHGVGLRRIMITAVKCIPADGRFLPPLISGRVRHNKIREPLTIPQVGIMYAVMNDT